MTTGQLLTDSQPDRRKIKFSYFINALFKKIKIAHAFYLSFSMAISLNACQTNNQNKITNAEMADNTVKPVADTVAEIQSINVIEKDTQTKSEIKIIENAEKKNEYFKLLSAASENWTAGIPSGGSGTEYYFKIKITTSDKLTFDTVWTKNKAFEIFISKESSSISSEPIKYNKGDIITLRVTELKKQNIKTLIVNSPVHFSGKALIGYFINGKRDYFIVKEIKKQTSPNRQ